MKHLIILAIICSSLTAFSQNREKAQQLINEGIALHDKGKYEAAIKKYEKAISVDDNNPSALFEASLTYTALKEFKKAIQYCDKLLNKNIDLGGQVYVNKATAYDLMGNPNQAIKVYKEGISKHPLTYLLHFNLAITYAGQKDFENAAPSFEEALKLNPEHTTSNIQLALSNYFLDKEIRSLLGAYYFLLLEPKGQRAKSALGLIDIIISKGAKKESENKFSITLPADALDTTDVFQTAKLMLPMLTAANLTGFSDGDSKFKSFYATTENVFKLVSDAKEKDNNEFYVKLYVYFFNELKEKGHLETYCYWITQSQYKESSTWLKKNEEKVDNFINWFLEYTKNNDLKNETTIGLDPNKKGKPAQIQMAPTSNK